MVRICLCNISDRQYIRATLLEKIFSRAERSWILHTRQIQRFDNIYIEHNGDAQNIIHSMDTHPTIVTPTQYKIGQCLGQVVLNLIVTAIFELVCNFLPIGQGAFPIDRRR